LKNGENYPTDWKDKKIKDELKALADRIKKYKQGDSTYSTENLIEDAFKYNFGSTELQNRKTNRFSYLVVLISIVTLFVAFVTYNAGNVAKKAQDANFDILSSINDHLNDIANDVNGDKDSQGSVDSNPLTPSPTTYYKTHF
jgi:hypothetical protein